MYVILGYRIGDIGYITDMKTMPEEEMELLKGVKILLVNGLRQKPHPTHQTIQDAVDFSKKIGSPETYIIHLCHHAGLHADVDAGLPDGVHLAYDGLKISL